MRSTAAELVMNGLDCSIDGRLRKGGVCAISQWVFAKHHDSKTSPSPLRSTPHGRQPSGHNPGAVRSRFAGPRLCGVDCSILRAGHRTFLPLARRTSTHSTVTATPPPSSSSQAQATVQRSVPVSSIACMVLLGVGHTRPRMATNWQHLGTCPPTH